MGEVFAVREPRLEACLDSGGNSGDGAEGRAGGEELARVLAALVRERGTNFASVLDGVFVVLISMPGRLLVARDAIGEHPVYALEDPQGVVLSDRMTPLIEHPLCARRLDAGGISDYLASGFCPFSRTPVEGVAKVPAGSCWSYDSNWSRESQQYHVVGRLQPRPRQADRQREDVGDSESRDLRPDIQKTRECLERAVSKRLGDHEGVGLFLSGGLDSSLVGALVGGERIAAAFSLSFGQRYRNELEFSSLVARHLEVPHHIVEVSARDARRSFERTARILDEPIGDPLTVPNALVAQRAREEVDVVFNGEGGDPLFGGPKNLPMLASELYESAGDSEGAALAREHRYLASYNKGYESLARLVTPDFFSAVVSRPLSAELLVPYFRLDSLPALLDRLMHINLRLKGASQILTKVYKVATAGGLLVQSPLFDRELAELAFSFPASHRLKGAVEKWILKEAGRDLLPSLIVDRPKSGMLVPVHYWFQRELRGFAHDLLLSRRARERGLFQHHEIRRLLRYRSRGSRVRQADRIWLLLSLEAWFSARGL